MDIAVRGDEYGECAGGGGVSMVMTGEQLSRDRAAYSGGNGSHESANDSIVELVL